MEVEGKITWISQDKTLPHTHANIQVEIPDGKLNSFEKAFKGCVEIARSIPNGA